MARLSSVSANEPGIPRSATELTPSFQSNGADHLPGLEGLLLAGACGRSQTSNLFQKRVAVVRGQPRITVQETGPGARHTLQGCGWLVSQCDHLIFVVSHLEV